MIVMFTCTSFMQQTPIDTSTKIVSEESSNQQEQMVLKPMHNYIYNHIQWIQENRKTLDNKTDINISSVVSRNETAQFTFLIIRQQRNCIMHTLASNSMTTPTSQERVLNIVLCKIGNKMIYV